MVSGGIDVEGDRDSSVGFVVQYGVGVLKDDLFAFGDRFVSLKPHHYLLYILSSYAAHARILGPHHPLAKVAAQHSGEIGCCEVEGVGIFMLDGDVDKFVEGRIAEHAALLDLATIHR